MKPGGTRTGGILVCELPGEPVRGQPLEIVERKGIGHPDTICDSVAEEIAVALSREYRKIAGRILHFNIDKGFLVAGQTDVRLGGGRVREPMRLIIGDRATTRFGARRIPVARIAEETARRWVGTFLPHVDPDRHVHYEVTLKPTSAELGALFSAGPAILPANDTSAAVGYAPLTPTEQLVLNLEGWLNGPVFKRAFPETGQDVKIMAIRRNQEVSVTVAMPLLAQAIRTERAYLEAKTRILTAIRGFIRQQPRGSARVSVRLNALDRRGAGLEGMYLTLLGTSAEQGDSGQIGRGNRVCGVLSLNRPVSGEAAAGKNPVSHVGKIYNVLAHQLALRIHREVTEVQEATVWLCSQIGTPINRPHLAATAVCLRRGVSLRRVRPAIEEIMADGLARIGPFCDALARGTYSIC